MSAAADRWAYFSNPDVVYNNVALGVAENQPKAANNARVLREKSLFMSMYRGAVAPKIVSQPQSITVAPGANALFAVAAAGNSLSYQWRKNGVAIVGATTTTYSISSTKSTDVGAYSVVVTNPYGSVTSNDATLALSADTGGASSSSSSSGSSPSAPASAAASGGGGGGAIGGWALAWMALLGLGRAMSIVRRRARRSSSVEA